MSEVLVGTCIVVICGIVNVLPMSVRVRVLLDIVIGIIGEEQAVPCTGLLALSPLFVAVGLIVSVKGSTLCNIGLILHDHRWEGAELRALLPWIVLHARVHC
jgi:hypothetical protein